jgi:hypothetical protein
LRRQPALLAAAVMALGVAGARAGEAPAEVDIEFLEFLGSLDAEEEEWREYLAERPIRSEPVKPAGQVAGKPESRRAPAPKPEPKQEEVKKP